MTFETNDETGRSAERTLGIVVALRRRTSRREQDAAGASSLAKCVDRGVLRLGSRGEHSLHVNGQSAAVGPPAVDGLARSYAGTADAIHRNLALVRDLAPARVLVQVGEGSDDVDYRALLATHNARELGVTVGCVEVPVEIARSFAVLGTDARGRVVRCADRPQRPQPLPTDAARALVAADLYVFDLEPLVDCLVVDAADPGSTHDLNRDVLPLLVRAGEVGAHVFPHPAVVSRYVPK
jgi:ADP-glucose pyrophosphorylase